ncbi:NAD(P)H-binding protein [Sphingomonas sp. Sphisp140]|uniref:NmrA family NAD(P)-binding protein n=1 Tax=unclassified Sphingomonas TaxID=196159 RepID=UPI0039AFCB3A
MYAMTGLTGQVGGALAEALLAEDAGLRALVRDASRAARWQEKVELVTGEIADVAALTETLRGTETAFVMLPAAFDPQPGFPDARAMIESVREALLAAKPERVVALSTIGARAVQPNLLNQLGLFEDALRDLPMPVAFLRAAWFMENAAWDVAPAREGRIASFLQPVSHAIPMVSAGDVGRAAATLMRQQWRGVRVVELEGPAPVSPEAIAGTFAALLGHPVEVQPVPRDSWEALFCDQGMAHPLPRIQMLDGFNQGWIAFGDPSAERMKGATTLAQAISGLLARDRASAAE